MDKAFRKLVNITRFFILRHRLRGKLMDLHALSAQQISDLYLGDAILGEIRTLQKQLDACAQGEGRFPPKISHGTDEIK